MKKLFSTICAVILLCVATVAMFGCSAAGYTEFGPTAVFSDDIALTAKIMSARADIIFSRMKDTVAQINAEVSATSETSELYKFNQAAAGERVAIGAHFDALFLLSREYYEITGGAFDPAFAPLIELWHVDAQSIAEYAQNGYGDGGSFDLPTPREVADVLEYCDLSKIERTVDGDTVYLTKSDARIKLDFGGIAKGYAVDKCVEILDEYSVSSALIDISGNAYFYGDYEGASNKQTQWNVGVVSPRPRAGESLVRGNVCAVALSGGVSAVTSGDYMRYYVHENNSGAVYVPHVIGKDGVPIGVYYDQTSCEWKNSEDHVISATVIGESSAECDALSTAVCAVGFDEGARLLQNLTLKGLIFSEKRFTIIGDVTLYAPDEYDGYKAYERV